MPTLVLVFALLRGVTMTPIEQMVHRNVVVEVDDGRCSGIILSTGLVLTVFHALETGSTVKVNGKEAEIIDTHPEADLILLKVETEEVPMLTFGVNVGVTTPVTQVGNPLSLSGAVSFGRVVLYNDTYLFLDTLAVKGFSGGGVYTSDGALVGMVQTMTGTEGSGSWIIRALKSEMIIKTLEK